MIDTLIYIFTDKQIFTYIIITLYAIQVIFQITVTHDYIFAGYWFSALMITMFAMQLSNRPA